MCYGIQDTYIMGISQNVAMSSLVTYVYNAL